MKSIAILSDIHGNLQALEAVLREVEALGVDEIVWGGDIVGYGANPRACVERVRQAGGPCVLGNHEWMALRLHEKEQAEQGIMARWRESGNPVCTGLVHALDEGAGDLVAWMKTLSLVESVEGAILSHAALHDQAKWPYLRSPEEAEPTLAVMRDLGMETAFFGHTHQMNVFQGPAPSVTELPLPSQPLVLETGRPHAITVGSVGQPRDGNPRAQWALWKPEAREVEFRRTLYNVKAAAAAIRAAGLPEHSAIRLSGWD
jgi:predicted phosphodiesterase